VLRLSVAHQPRDLVDRQGRLPGEQLRGRPQAAILQVLAEGRAAELGVGALELAGGARQHRG